MWPAARGYSRREHITGGNISTCRLMEHISLIHQGNTYLRGRGRGYLFGGTENQGEYISPLHRHLATWWHNWFSVTLIIVSAARSLTCRDDLDSKWRLLWLKTNYCVYLCCLEFLSGINCPSFFLSISASEESIKGAEIDCSTPQIKMATLKEVVSILKTLSHRFFEFMKRIDLS